MAVLCCVVANMLGDKRATAKRFLLSEILKRGQPQSVDEMARKFKAFAKQHNARLKAKRDKPSPQPSAN